MIEADVLSPYTTDDEGGDTALVGEAYALDMWAVRASLPEVMLPAPNTAFLRIRCEQTVLDAIEADDRFEVIATY
jgi:hypothetical protein